MYGINFCHDCLHNEPFQKTSTEPAYIRVRYSGSMRARVLRWGGTKNLVDILDETQTVSASMVVPDAAIDEPGSIKRAISECESPGRIRCGAEIILREMFTN